MNAAGMTIIYRVDLDAPQNVVWIGTLLVQGDERAHKIVAEMYRGREKHMIGEGVTAIGVFVRSDGYAIPLGGEIAGNTVSITLDGACYEMAGQCYLSIVLNDQGGERTVLKAAGRVDQEENNGYIDETVYTSFDALVEAAVNAYLGSNPGSGGGGITGPYVQSINGKTGAVMLKTSDLENNSGFITKAVADLANYYLKSETYTREEINQKISQIPKFDISVVNALPESGNKNTIYLVGGGISGNLYTEYIWADGAWEILGSQRVDLTGYATEDWVNDQLEQAAASGEFDGKDGVGISNIVQIKGLPESGSEQIYRIYLSNNTYKDISVYNGTKGEDGVGIKSIEQTVVSKDDGGINEVEVVKTNGNGVVLKIQNGHKGSDGEPGSSGVHIGADEPTDPGINVWIDPNGEPSGYEKWVFTLADGSTVTKKVVVLS